MEKEKKEEGSKKEEDDYWGKELLNDSLSLSSAADRS